MINLVDELEKAYNGDAWHGSNALNLILKADTQKVFTHPIPNAHSIAELVLHLTAWTEEVLDRIQGKEAKSPTRGDWPTPIEKTEQEWEIIVKDFSSANERLIAAANNLLPAQWPNIVVDKRSPELGTGVNNAQLINGLIQHHAYHSGQIALLLKF
ncbi:DinB family protein [Pedobacter boryungensis]|uniref:DinB family protein n=1 Tax=Pedobacter boryungensis TaxID=869962 RepID=A0ABX2DGP7_9SPHI|nr:DinB family protein [Pedobacter boryungensis]NQX32481.1 DinB family protein [Pedobacter boryungensis]